MFSGNDAEHTLDRGLFGRHFSVASFDNCTQRRTIDQRRKLPLTEQEKSALNCFQLEEESIDGLENGDNGEQKNEYGDASIYSTVSDVNSTLSNDENSGKWPPTVETENVKSAVRKRMITIGVEKKYENTIVDSVKFFNAKMNRQMKLLQNQRNRSERITRDKLPHERVLRLSRMEFMLN